MSRVQVAVVSIAVLLVVGAGGYLVYSLLNKSRTYPQSVRDNFLVSCAGTGGSDNGCVCALRAVEDAFSLSDFTAFDLNVRQTGQLPAPITDVVVKRCGVALRAATTSTTTATLSEASSRVVGTTDTDASHWRPTGPAHTYDVRVYGSTPSIIQDPAFNVVMNGCADGQIHVSWRSLGDKVVPGLTTFLDPGMSPTVDRPGSPAASGTMVLSWCEQPSWRALTANNLVDLVVDVTDYSPAVGD